MHFIDPCTSMRTKQDKTQATSKVSILNNDLCRIMDPLAYSSRTCQSWNTLADGYDLLYCYFMVTSLQCYLMLPYTHWLQCNLQWRWCYLRFGDLFTLQCIIVAFNSCFYFYFYFLGLDWFILRTALIIIIKSRVFHVTASVDPLLVLLSSLKVHFYSSILLKCKNFNVRANFLCVPAHYIHLMLIVLLIVFCILKQLLFSTVQPSISWRKIISCLTRLLQILKHSRSIFI